MQRNLKAIVLIVILGLVLIVTQAYAQAPDQFGKHSQDTISTPEGAPASSADDSTVESQKGNKPDKPGKPDKANKADDDADDQNETEHGGKKTNFRGEIFSISADSITLNLEDGTSVTVAMNADTKIHIPGGKQAETSLAAGMKVIVQAVNLDGNYTAVQVHAKPGKPQKVHRVGTVVGYESGVSITIENKKGEQSTFALTADTVILPAERVDQLQMGALVTIIAPRNVAGGPLTAKGIVVHPEKTDDDTD